MRELGKYWGPLTEFQGHVFLIVGAHLVHRPDFLGGAAFRYLLAYPESPDNVILSNVLPSWVEAL